MNFSISVVSILLASACCCSCVPIPIRLYVAEAPKSALVYSACSFNSHVPVAVKMPVGPGLATVALSKHDGRAFVELQLDLPTGVTVLFDDDALAIATASPDTSSRARFPSVSLVDAPILNSYSSVPDARKHQIPVRSPLVGGKIQMGTATSDRHFWLAAYIDTAAANEVIVTLPSFSLNGVTLQLEPVRFKAENLVGVALINC